MTDEVRPFNLYRAGNVATEKGAQFNAVVQTCAAKLRAELCQMTQGDIKISGKAVNDWKFMSEDSDERFFKTWASLNDYTNEYTLILIEKNIFFALMEMIFGGEIDAAAWRPVARKATSVEWQMYMRILDHLLKYLRDAMSASCEFDVKVLVDPKEASRAEHLHKDLHGYVTTDVYDVDVEGVTGLIKMEYPATLVKQAMGNTLCSKAASSKLEQIKEALKPVPLSVKGAIPLTEMSFNEILGLKEGDFIPLPPTTKTEVCVAGTPWFHAELFEKKGRLALNLENSLFETDRFERMK